MLTSANFRFSPQHTIDESYIHFTLVFRRPCKVEGTVRCVRRAATPYISIPYFPCQILTQKPPLLNG
ncbi:unnamed protein product, partial [Iphiclides podalirius]